MDFGTRIGKYSKTRVLNQNYQNKKITSWKEITRMARKKKVNHSFIPQLRSKG